MIIDAKFLIILDNSIRFIGYVGLLLGAVLLILPVLKPLINSNKYKFALKKKKENVLITHINKLLKITINNNSTYISVLFISLSISLFIVTFILLYQTSIRKINCIFYSLAAGFIPYILLRAKLHTIRIESSYEGIEMCTELINQYKINYLNMIEAIAITIERLDRNLHSRQAFIRMLDELYKYKNIEDLNRIINDFIYSINTEWSILLGNNIFLAIQYNDDVRESLEDVLNELKDLNRLNEKYKQTNHESFIMIKFITPVFYIVSVFVMFWYFKFTFKKFLDYQFFNPLGFKFFTLTIVSIVINYILYILIRKPKNDF